MSRQALFQEDTRFRILQLLQKEPDLSQPQLAARIGISAGGLNYCLRALIEKGLVKVQNLEQSRNKLKYAYVLTPRGLLEKSMLTARFLSRKMREFEALEAEIEALRREVGEGVRNSVC